MKIKMFVFGIYIKDYLNEFGHCNYKYYMVLIFAAINYSYIGNS